MALNPLIALQVKTPGDLAEQQSGIDARQQAMQASQQQMQQASQLQPYKVQAAQQDIDLGKLKEIKAKNDAVGQIIMGVKNQQTYDAARQQIISMGLPAPPPNYDPDYVEAAAMRTLDMHQKLSLQLQSAGQQETQRHNLASENNARMRITGGVPGMTSIDPETGDVTNVQSPAGGFGFPSQNYPPVVFKNMATEDSKRRTAGESNRPIARNILNILDNLEPNLDKFTTGSGGETRLGAEKFAKYISGGLAYDETATAGNNIEKGTNDLATELGKFQHMPGNRGSVLGLQTILASKPGVTQDPQTNKNIVAGLRAKATDALLSDELQQQYRERSPYKITDQNVDRLDDALKTIYPLYSKDNKTNKVVFNPENADKIRDAMGDAIANPQKYLQMAKSSKGGSTPSKSNAPVAPASTERKIGTIYSNSNGEEALWTGEGWAKVGKQ